MSNFLTLYYDWNTHTITDGHLKYVNGFSTKVERQPLESHMDRLYVLSTNGSFCLMAIYSDEGPEDNWYVAPIMNEEYYNIQCNKIFEGMSMRESTQRTICEFSKIKYRMITKTTYSEEHDLKVVLYKFGITN